LSCRGESHNPGYGENLLVRSAGLEVNEGSLRERSGFDVARAAFFISESDVFTINCNDVVIADHASVDHRSIGAPLVA